MPKIGVLLPRSTYYETIGFDLFEGLRSGLNLYGFQDVKIVTENIGFGSDKQQCYRSAEKLLLEENVTMVIAYIGQRMAQLLRPLFLAANKILIVLDSGANLPTEYPSCPNIIYHSLQNSLGAWLSSKQATEDGYFSAGMVTGYYDGGYLQTYSLCNSFEQAGGQICFNHATGYKENDFTMEPLKNYLDEFPKSALLSLFSGDYVQWYFSGIKDWISDKKTTIYLSPFGVEETMLQKAVFPNCKIKGVAAWSKNIDSQENDLFVNTIKKAGRTPNLFSLLAWESAQIIIQVFDLLNKNENNSAQTISDLLSFEFVGPRGKVSFNSKTNTSVAPLYEVEIVLNEEDGMCKVNLLSEIKDTKKAFELLSELEIGLATSAWYNSYVCV
ncbi:ABC transporter substrate-binding protein [Flavobacterium ranwuense]|uniref:ABC transporter substrate-binding protein n=1 Tax=Flavobacterium ranwuense TaxID=2541725 RepID=A0ABY2DRV5_9FLAO|nr:ABC transporter substrate-binding protein [Flavobacterium ranwuense]TDE28227.1 ABC transporter substrate-binding protein [Flavobacterium ranwuense]